jgi:ribosomal protein S18 acetylase RimI-like enzyme
MHPLLGCGKEGIMQLAYALNERVDVADAVELLKRSNLSKDDAQRLVRIVPEANVVVTARDGEKLVGLARGLKEISGCCYLSDLIVDKAYTDQAIGENLIRHVHDAIGENTLIVLVPAPDAMAYNADIG